MTGGAADSRVSIPNHHRKLIQEINKSLGFKNTDDFIYTTLIDCDLDPNEAARRLKMIHDIREIAGKHSVEDVYIMLKDCHMDPNEAAQRLLYIDTFHEVKKKHDRRKPISSDPSEEYKRTRGNQWQGAKGGRGAFYSSKVFDDVGGGRTLSSGKENGVANHPERVSRVAPLVHSGKENNAALVAKSAANVNNTLPIPNGSYSNKLAPEVSSDVSSTTLDPVVVPFENTHHICAVGTIKCEITKRSGSSKSNAKLPAGIKSSADQVVAGVTEAVDTGNTNQSQSNEVEKNQMPDVLQPLSVSTNKDSYVIPNQDNQPSQLLNEPLKVTASEHTNVSINNADLVSGEEPELKRSDPKLDVMLEKLTLSSHQPVIFPDHFEVPENFRSQFTFGSLDATLDDCRPLSVAESTQTNGEVVTEPSSSNENVATTAQEGETQDHPLPHLSEDTLPSKDDISSLPAIKQEQAKVEATPTPTIGGFQNPVLQTTRDYPFGFMPHLVAPHFVQLDVPELQSGSSQVTSTLGSTPVAQSTTTVQSSMALSPPLFPYFRQPYPNYIPYNPYFPHMYLPQHAHLLNHGVFPQQPPTGNIYMHPAAAGVKFPVPSQYKQGSSAGSFTHGPYGSSATPGSSANEELNASQAKDNDPHSDQQGEDPQVWAPAAGRDNIPNLLPNYFYNFPHPQHMAFSPLQAGIYHTSPPMTAQTTAAQPLVYPPQSTGGTAEPMPPPPTSYQQPQSNWNTALTNRETS